MQHVTPKQWLLLVAAAALTLAPFLGKAFHTDDPLFLWIGQQIIKHPLDPYGFDVNWSSFVQPMSEVMQNPPLCSYYIAGVASIFGWGETALHLAFLPWAILAIMGTLAVARNFCSDPLVAALITLFTPVFLVSATSVMCDVMMLALWLWSIELWLRGLDRQSSWRLFASALLISAAALTKYFGIALVPLLLAYTLARERRFNLKLAYLLVPIAVLSNYDFLTAEKYGHGLFSAALNISSLVSSATKPSLAAQVLMGLAFLGGSLFNLTFFLPLWRKRTLLSAGVVAIIFAAAFKFLIVSWIYLDSPELPVWTEGGLFASLAVGILALVVAHFVRKQAPETLLLLLWTAGTFCFAVFFNWSITARTLLPMAPPMAILAAQQFANANRRPWSRTWRLAASAGLSIVIAAADCFQANSARAAAEFFEQRDASKSDKLQFLGHSGFQYYMQQWGAKLFDRNKAKIGSGEIVIGPFSDINFARISIERISGRDEFNFKTLPLISTGVLGCGANFYTSFGGPLPWVINKIPSERYYEIRAE